MEIPVSPEVSIVTGTVTFNAIGQLKPLTDAPFFVRSLLVVPRDTNTGTIMMAYGAGSARRIPLPREYPGVEGKFYDLNKFIVEPTVAADILDWEAQR